MARAILYYIIRRNALNRLDRVAVWETRADANIYALLDNLRARAASGRGSAPADNAILVASTSASAVCNGKPAHIRDWERLVAFHMRNR